MNKDFWKAFGFIALFGLFLISQAILGTSALFALFEGFYFLGISLGLVWFVYVTAIAAAILTRD